MLVASVPAVGSVTPMDCRRNSPLAMLTFRRGVVGEIGNWLKKPL